MMLAPWHREGEPERGCVTHVPPWIKMPTIPKRRAPTVKRDGKVVWWRIVFHDGGVSRGSELGYILCHPERSEGSHRLARQVVRSFAGSG